MTSAFPQRTIATNHCDAWKIHTTKQHPMRACQSMNHIPPANVQLFCEISSHHANFRSGNDTPLTIFGAANNPKMTMLVCHEIPSHVCSLEMNEAIVDLSGHPVWRASQSQLLAKKVWDWLMLTRILSMSPWPSQFRIVPSNGMCHVLFS